MINIKQEGFKNVEKLFDRLTKGEQKKAMRNGLTKGAKPLLKEAKSLAPKDTGRLRKALKSRNSKTRNKGEVARNIFIYQGKSRQDTKGAWYGSFVNSGYVKNGKYYPGKHFISKAYNSKKYQAAKIIEKHAANKIIEIAKGN